MLSLKLSLMIASLLCQPFRQLLLRKGKRCTPDLHIDDNTEYSQNPGIYTTRIHRGSSDPLADTSHGTSGAQEEPLDETSYYVIPYESHNDGDSMRVWYWHFNSILRYAFLIMYKLPGKENEVKILFPLSRWKQYFFFIFFIRQT